MFWNAWFVEGHDEQKGKYNCKRDEYIHGEGAHWFWLFGFSFIERTSKPLQGTGFVIFGAVESLEVLATYSMIGLRSSPAR